MTLRRRAATSWAAAATIPLLLLTAVTVATAPAAQAAVANGSSIVHLFQWRWSSIARECETTLGPNGWGGVQVSPPQEHVVLPSAEGATYPWWQDYQPVSYRLDETRRGTRAEFVDMVTRCRNSGVKIYVDVVLNHMSGTGSAGSGPGSAGTVYSKYEYPNLFNDGSGDAYTYPDFGSCYTTISNWGNKAEVQDCELLALADLNTGDPEVRRKIAKYMNAVIDLGVAGFRVDAAKHVQEAHLADVISRLHDVPGFGGRPDIFHEVYGDATIPYTAYAPLGKVTNFDYQRAVASGFQGGNIAQFANLPNYGGLSGGQAVVFVDNHDTQRASPTLTYKNGDRYYLADAFMMAHPYGTVQLMSSYAFGANQAQGPPSSSNGTTSATDCANGQWICEHRNEQVAGMPSFRNATEGTGVSGTVTDGNGRLAFARGSRGYAAFNATGDAWSRTFSTSLPDGTYCNVARGTFNATTGACSGGTIGVAGGAFTTSIPANRGVALHVNARTNGTPTPPPPTTPPPAGDTTFTVTAPTGQDVYVVGSVAQLGAWTPASGLRLTPGAAAGSFSGSVSIPAGTAFEWKLVRISNGQVTWESTPNRGGTGGAAHTATWNQAGGGGTAAVAFNATATTTFGQNVFVVGSTAPLGAWNPAAAVALSPTQYPVWTGTVSLPTGQAVEYKLVKKNPDGTVTWESGANRTLTPSGGTTVTITWR
ncbi:carbohydrate-binding module family 20 domain-containing protein [Phytohabitans houttuyneae]|uniref:carbohydrate-binding module family 20 domain-containing protein n=1 Tax=Phytohabitans houttuyneae TaxID=1076126 RepID=UPI0015667775|nr:carbohydrate-binding module family 20 domain-containing protein [Phytohabitans houttuyneae]